MQAPVSDPANTRSLLNENCFEGKPLASVARALPSVPGLTLASAFLLLLLLLLLQNL